MTENTIKKASAALFEAREHYAAIAMTNMPPDYERRKQLQAKADLAFAKVLKAEENLRKAQEAYASIPPE